MPAARAYEACITQWRVGMAGASGLDYGACIAILTLWLPGWQSAADADTAMHAITLADLLIDLRTIEHALLTAWAEQRDKDKPDPTTGGDRDH